MTLEQVLAAERIADLIRGPQDDGGFLLADKEPTYRRLEPNDVRNSMAPETPE